MPGAVVTPLEINGQHWITVSIDGQELQPQGPFQTIDGAAAAARRVAGFCQMLLHPPARNDAPVIRRRAG